MSTSTSPSRRLAALGLLLVVLGAFALRMPAPATPPPGLYHDEAFNGLDAVSVLDGDLRLYFPANNGREPLHIYLMAGFVAVLGRSPAALRLAMAFVGTVTVAAVFALGAALFDRRVGWIAAALVAVAPWPVLLGRVGLRAGTLPLVLSLAVAATARGVRRDDTRWIAAGGALAGLTLYTYTAARAGPLLVVLFGLWLAWRGRLGGRHRGRHRVVPWVVGALAVALPLLVTFALAPDETLGRAAQVSLTDPDVRDGSLAGALVRSALATAGMVAVEGDFIPRHNIPYRPVFGTLAAMLAGIGLIAAVLAAWLGARARRAPPGAEGAGAADGGVRRGSAAVSDSGCSAGPDGRGWADGAVLVLLWLLVFALPTLLAEGAPHFLRVVGVLPAVALLPAIGAAFLADRGRGHGLAATRLVWLVALVAVGAELAATAGYARAVEEGAGAGALYFPFEAGASELASEVNAVLDTGWRDGWAAGRPGEGGGSVWLDRRLRDGWASVPYLVPTDALTLTDPYDAVFTTGPGTAFLWPYDLDLAEVWSDRAPNLRLSFEPGAYERGDLDPEPRLLYLRVDATTPDPIDEPVAAFANGLRLVASRMDVDPTGQRVTIETEWEAGTPVDRDVTAFFQVLEGGTVAAASDAPLGEGRYPVPYWRPGDRVVERRVLDVPGGYQPDRQTIITGLYEWPSVERIPVVDEEGIPLADTVPLSR